MACQINMWENHIKPFLFIQCIEGPAFQYQEELDPVFNEIFLIILTYFFEKCPLQIFNANEPDFMLKYFQTVFHKRLLSENESIQAYAFELKVLANKVYPYNHLHNLKNIIIYTSLQKAWEYLHDLNMCYSIEEAIDIALGREIFSGSYTCSQNHKYNVLDQTQILLPNETNCYKLNAKNTKIHRSKPYKKIKT